MLKLGLIQSIHEALQALLHEERKGLVEFLRQLFVFDREMGYAPYGCPSTFEYLVRVLHLAEGTAYRRLAAMRLVHRYPQVASAIEAGFVNATQLAILSKVISDANVDVLLRDARHLSKRKTEELVVSIRPKDVPTPGMRKLPAPAVRPVAALELVDAQSSVGEATPHAPKVTPPVEGMGMPWGTPGDLSLAPTPPSPNRPRTRLEPFAAERWSWRLVIDLARKERLDRLTGYLAHKFPDGDLEKIFDQMLADSLEEHGRRLGFIAPKHPRAIPEQMATPGIRQRVPLAVRRAVLERDGHRCTEICADGQRCRETRMLEMDHLNPAKETGSSTVDDLVTKCRAHNQYRAVRTYGRPYIERRKEEGRREREARRAKRAVERSQEKALGTLPLLVKEPVARWGEALPYAAAG